MRIEFTDDLLSGHEVIDLQHRELIRWANILARPDGAIQQQGKVKQALDFLALYVEHHFRAEERAMQATAYPRLESHRKGHTWFQREVRTLAEGMDNTENVHAALLRLGFLMGDWFLQHIRYEDLRMARWLEDHPSHRMLADEDTIWSYMQASGIDPNDLDDIRFVRPIGIPRPGERRVQQRMVG